MQTHCPKCGAEVRASERHCPVCQHDVANALKAEVAQRLTAAGQIPLVLTSGPFVGEQRSRELFEEVYNDHRRRIGVLYR